MSKITRTQNSGVSRWRSTSCATTYYPAIEWRVLGCATGTPRIFSGCVMSNADEAILKIDLSHDCTEPLIKYHILNTTYHQLAIGSGTFRLTRVPIFKIMPCKTSIFTTFGQSPQYCKG